MSDEIRRLRVEIQGAVQGVGFRPYIYRLAAELGLAGWVLNDSRGVFIEVEGPVSRLERFLERLPREIPPRARIYSLQAGWLDAVGYPRFEIRHSESEGEKTALVLPDIATCARCLAEILDPEDRRYRYPFTNCTDCGPRFTILEALPYDRPNTTMRRFRMCPTCQAEYENPLDRRFHAQPNACPECGPTLAFYARTSDPVEGEVDHPDFPRGIGGFGRVAMGEAALQEAAQALRAGQIVAVKGLGGFHLMVDARNEAAIARLRARKPRRDKPFALMAKDLAQVRTLCELPPEAEALLAGPEAPIVLLPRQADAPVAPNVAPDNPYLGVMLPYTPLHHLLLRELDFPVVATSGNLTDEPICTDEREAFQRLARVADAFLIHNRPIARHVDDSVMIIMDGEPRLLRRARGFAPLPILVNRPLPPILAVGGHLKNTIALSVGRQIFLSQHIGDLDTAEALGAFERVIFDFLRLYEAEPVAIAHDMHPDYVSTIWAQRAAAGDLPQPLSSRAPLPLIPVQHHHAHLVACLAEHNVEGPALGITWDGTGYGLDGTIWGGEFLVGDAYGFHRVASLRPFRLPGGDAAIHAPCRVAFALLWELAGDMVIEWEDLAPVRALRPIERQVLARMIARGVNAPLTSSMGRLFDAVAALLDLRQEITFEGQAAMALEFAADPSETRAYPFPFCENPSGEPAQVLDWRPLLEAILKDLRRGVERERIAARFHNALIEGMITIAREIGEGRVALSGGCFQNRLLTERAARRIREGGFTVLIHRQVPPNDGGISLGQIRIAAAYLERFP
ncbi:MAG: carbamoyltransferase HypF [Anaerolineae bacterium]|uniref:carbamoyltransferase HypF n=1 Tax=Thermoflexus sp. TaxID=1969742 RepID=UPI0025E26AB5|nr:carbamoyltransferase HypF [Thermoflexus sp.]MCS7350451.1 carbamoyltransferase HypF [Thermoflexus sp.]MDW8179902.1 carbamoyltransferase HypF [Anaerolineae bacterium]